MNLNLIMVGIIIELFVILAMYLFFYRSNLKSSKQPSIPKDFIKNLKF